MLPDTLMPPFMLPVFSVVVAALCCQQFMSDPGVGREASSGAGGGMRSVRGEEQDFDCRSHTLSHSRSYSSSCCAGHSRSQL